MKANKSQLSSKISSKDSNSSMSSGVGTTESVEFSAGFSPLFKNSLKTHIISKKTARMRKHKLFFDLISGERREGNRIIRFVGHGNLINRNAVSVAYAGGFGKEFSRGG